MNFLKRIPLFEILLVAAILGINLYAALSDAYNLPNAWFVRDDAYYYFKVAQNITEGKGSSFDGINPTNGYHPLWMLVCIPIFALARFDLILPLRILVVVIAILNAATAVLIYRLVRDNLSRAVGMAAASFWAFSIHIQSVAYKLGLETPLAAFGIVLLLHNLSKFEKSWRTQPVTSRQIIVLALSAALAMFSRLDLVFLAFLGGLWIILRGKPMRFLLPLDMLIVFLSMTASVALRTGIPQYNSTYANSALEAAVLAIVLKLISLYFFGAYRHPRAASVLETIRRTASAVTFSSAAAAILYLLLVQLGVGKNFPRSAFLIEWGLSLLLILALRLAMIWFGGSKIDTNMPPVAPLEELKANWKKWLADGAVYYGIVGGLLALYMLYNKIVFGAASPVSGQIKRWWGTLLDSVYERPVTDWGEFLGISYHSAYEAWQPVTTALVWLAEFLRPLHRGSDAARERYYIAMAIALLVTLVILMVNARRARRAFSNMALLPLMAGCGFQILSYTATAYGGTKEWYWVSEMVLVTLGGSLLLHLLLHPLQKNKVTRYALELGGFALGAFLALQLNSEVRFVMPHGYFPADRPYMEVLPYLEENTPPGSVIGMTGGGNVGYFIQDRTIVNMDGLINSYEYFQALKNKQAPVYLGEHGMTIVFANPRLLGLPPYYGQFAPYFENYSQYGGKNLIYLLEEPKYQP
jgi:hypothetical protein